MEPSSHSRFNRRDHGNTGVAMARAPDDDEVDLGVSLETVATIVDLARSIQGKEETDADQATEDANSEAALLQETPDDMTGDALRQFIEELNEDEQASLIALAWTGRGDYGPEDWDEARSLAAERNESDAASYLLEMDMLGDLLAEGVASFGLSIEDVER
jgi:Protein of unknown function (DUF3775)